MPLHRNAIWLYGALGLPLALLSYPLAIWLPRAYGTGIGLDLAVIGLIITLAAVLDAITDPVVGFASDRVRGRFGRRKGWISVGVPLLTLAVWMLLNPSQGATALYLAGWYLALRVGSTLVLVPYGAWGAELAQDYGDRIRINSARQRCVLLGLIVATLVPAGIELLAGRGTSSLTILAAFSYLILILLPAIGLMMLWRLPEPPPSPAEGSVRFLRSLKLMWRNGLFRRVVIIELIINGGEQFRNTLSLFFMQDAIGITNPGQLYLMYFACGLAAMPLWDTIARRLGKHRSLAAAMVLVSLVSVGIFALDYGQITAFWILFGLKGVCFGAFAYLPLAMLADVVDIDTARTGDARTGGYFAVHGFMTKCAFSFGGLSLPLLAAAGYSAIPGAINSASALTWLAALYALVPTTLFALAFWLCWTWPLDARRHARLREALDRRATRKSLTMDG